MYTACATPPAATIASRTRARPASAPRPRARWLRAVQPQAWSYVLLFEVLLIDNKPTAHGARAMYVVKGLVIRHT